MYEDLQAVDYAPFAPSSILAGLFRRADVPEKIEFDVRKDFLDRKTYNAKVFNFESWCTAVSDAFAMMGLTVEYEIIGNRKRGGVVYAAVAGKQYFGVFDMGNSKGYVTNGLYRVNCGMTADSIMTAMEERWKNGSSPIAYSTGKDDGPQFVMPMFIRYRNPFVVKEAA